CVVWCVRCFCFFFQAEDGIRDLIVTGVQTCALPISAEKVVGEARGEPGPGVAAVGALVNAAFPGAADNGPGLAFAAPHGGENHRSEERRVGKEGRSRWGKEREKKNNEYKRRADV